MSTPAATLNYPAFARGDELPHEYVNDVQRALNQHAGKINDLEANAGNVFTPADARLAQLNRVASAGTTTVTLTAESPTDYGTASNGSFTVDATNCVVGKVVRFAVAASGSAPAFTAAPARQPYKQLGVSYASGHAYSYSLLVGVDVIEVVCLLND